jgi:hypothetical protein
MVGVGAVALLVSSGGIAQAQKTPEQRTFDAGSTPNPWPSNFYDFSFGEYKAECTSGGAIVSISTSASSGRAHSVLCASPISDPLYYTQTNPENAFYEKDETFASTNSADYGHHPVNGNADWDSQYLKGECPVGSMVVGVAQTTSSGQVNAIHCADTGLASCSALGVAHPSTTTCHTVAPPPGSHPWPSVWGEWSFGFDKLACGSGEVAVGMSVDTTNHNPHTILCCTVNTVVC